MIKIRLGHPPGSHAAALAERMWELLRKPPGADNDKKDSEIEKWLPPGAEPGWTMQFWDLTGPDDAEEEATAPADETATRRDSSK